MDLFPGFSEDVPPVPRTMQGTALELFQGATYEDSCSDASLGEVVAYLRGCTGLRIPHDWVPLMPQHI